MLRLAGARISQHLGAAFLIGIALFYASRPRRSA
jgi:hypothetical protein